MASGGMDWFRWHHGSVNDPKFQLVARKVGCSLAEVIAVWACVLEAASQSEQRGAHGVLDFESMDCALGLPDGRTQDIYLRMQERALVDGEVVQAWHKRQPKRERDSDASTDRVRAFRERNRTETPDSNTPPSNSAANGVADDETPCNAAKRLEESREEESNTTSSLRSDVVPRKRAQRTTAAPSLTRPDHVPENVWQDFQALRAAKRAPLTDTALRGIEREAGKVGLNLAEALAYCCEAGWQGFNAGWYENRLAAASPRPVTQPAEGFRERDQRLARERVAAFAPGVAARPRVTATSVMVVDADARRVEA